MEFKYQNQNPNVSQPIKLKAKSEVQDSSPLTLPPSSRFIEDACALSYSTFTKVMLGIFLDNLQFLNKPGIQLTRFPVFLNDPFAVNINANFKTALENLPKMMKPNNPNIPKSQKTQNTSKAVTPKAIKKTYSVKPTKHEKNFFLKKEKKVETNQEDKSNCLPKKVPKKQVQNRIKNFPGLIVQRVRTNIKAYLTRNPKFEKLESRLGYINKVVGCLNKQEKKRMLIFLESYKKTWKTWSTIEKYLQSDPECGEMFLNAVLEFFGEDGLDDYDMWMNSGKMGEKSKATLVEMKDKIRSKFSKLALSLEDEKENDNHLSLIDNIVKKEEYFAKKEEHI